MKRKVLPLHCQKEITSLTIKIESDMEMKVTYVARYESEICDNAFQMSHTSNFILCVFDNITEAEQYAQQYYDKDCGKDASIQVKKNKKGGLFIKVKDTLANREKHTIEHRRLIIEGAILNSGNTALEDIQDRMME